MRSESASTRSRPIYGSLQDLSKYRQAALSSSMTTQLLRQNVVGGTTRDIGKYRRESIAQQQVSKSDAGAAVQLAQQNSNIIFERGLYGGGILYEIRALGAQDTIYEDVEDGFTQSRTNYNESTVTLNELASQFKTLKRDLARRGII